MVVKIYHCQNYCAHLVWERVGGNIVLVQQNSIGIVDLPQATKSSFNVDGGINHLGIQSLPAVDPDNWRRYAVCNEGEGVVVPTQEDPLEYDDDWYQAPLSRPVYTVPAATLTDRMNKAPEGLIIDDLVIDAGNIFYSAFQILAAADE